MVKAIDHKSPFTGTVRVYEGRQNAVLGMAGFKESITEFCWWMLPLLYISAAERKKNGQKQATWRGKGLSLRCHHQRKSGQPPKEGPWRGKGLSLRFYHQVTSGQPPKAETQAESERNAAHWLSSSSLCSFLKQPRPICLGMGPPTVC